MEGAISCLDYYWTVDDPFSRTLQEGYKRKFPDPKHPFTAGSGSTGMYRGVKFYEAAVRETSGQLAREDVAAALDHAVLQEGPGGGAEMVPGHYHAKMNMYIAVCKIDAGTARFEIIDKATMVDPREC